MKLVRALVIVLSMSCTCLGQSVRQIAQTAFKSVVLLEMSDLQGQPVSLGSGFFIADGIIATNAHVIEGAARGTAKLIGSEQKFSIQGIVALDRHTDLALLKVGSAAPVLNLGPEAKPTVGDKVYVVGNPLGLEGTFSEGIVSGIRSIQSDSVLQMTAPISPGSSGGPVMNDSGTVIGIAEATFKDGQNLNLAVPVAYLSEMWAAASQRLIVTPLAQQTQVGSGQSIVDRIGTRVESGVTISDFELNYQKVGYGGDKAGFQLRISNKLPVAIAHIKLRIIYHDASNSIMDFEDYSNHSLEIPPGLTKTVTMESSEEALRAAQYYSARGTNGSPLSGREILYGYDSNWNPVKKMEPKVEIRIVGFDTDESQ
jgi:hypothetical protein